MDDFEKKLIAQFGDDFPGVRVQALDSWRDYLKKNGRTVNDVLHEFETSISQQKYAELEAQHNTALQHNTEFAQRNQQQEQKITELSRKVALYKVVATVQLNWRWAAGLAVLPIIGWCGYQYFLARSWPDNADSGLRHMASSEVVWGQFDKPFVKTIASKPLWVLVQGQVDNTNFADKDGRPVLMRCVHIYAVPAETADSGEYARPQPYGLFGWLRWPERAVHCTPAPNQTEASR